MADHHHHEEVVVKKAKLDPWRVNRGTKLSFAEYNRFMRIPFFTTNHLNLMFSWIVSFSIIGYTFFNMFLPWNIDGGKAYQTSLYKKQLENRGVFTKENNPYNPEKWALWTEARNQVNEEKKAARS